MHWRISLTLCSLAGATSAATCEPTHSMITGPAYVPNLPVVREICSKDVSSHNQRASSLLSRHKTGPKRVVISGRVVDEDCKPVPDVRLEIWQPNGQGTYDIVAHECKGALELGSDGRFHLETDEPGSYGMTGGQIEGFDLPAWGVKHIHWLVYAPGHNLLVSQWAFEWDPLLAQGDYDWRQVLAGAKFSDPFLYYDHSIVRRSTNSNCADQTNS